MNHPLDLPDIALSVRQPWGCTIVAGLKAVAPVARLCNHHGNVHRPGIAQNVHIYRAGATSCPGRISTDCRGNDDQVPGYPHRRLPDEKSKWRQRRAGTISGAYRCFGLELALVRRVARPLCCLVRMAIHVEGIRARLERISETRSRFLPGMFTADRLAGRSGLVETVTVGAKAISQDQDCADRLHVGLSPLGGFFLLRQCSLYPSCDKASSGLSRVDGAGETENLDPCPDDTAVLPRAHRIVAGRPRPIFPIPKKAVDNTQSIGGMPNLQDQCGCWSDRSGDSLSNRPFRTARFPRVPLLSLCSLRRMEIAEGLIGTSPASARRAAP